MAKAQKSAAAPAPASRPVKKGDHVFLVDGSGYIFRAYHALPPLNRKSDGLQVNAVLGFCNMLWKLLRDMKPEDRPTHLAVVFDKSERTFRNELYADYKAHRPDAPADLIPQFPLIREAVRAFDIPCLEMLGFEADDLIATYAREACAVQANVTIVSSDKDLMQLVNECVIMYDTMKDKKIGVAEVIEKFGVPPDKVIEVQSLIGDSTDNVPGVPGIGVKTAAQLIGEYGDLETLLSRAGEIKQEKRRQALIDNAEKARISKVLVTLDDKVKLEVPLADLAVHEPDYARLIAFLKAMEFSTLTRRVAEFSGADAGAIEPSAAAPQRERATAPAAAPSASASPGLPLTGGGMTPKPRTGAAEPAVQLTPQTLVGRAARGGAPMQDRLGAIRGAAGHRAAQRLDRARVRSRRGRAQRRDDRRRPDDGRAVRARARDRAERELLRAAGASEGRQWRRSVRRRSGAGPDRGEERARGAEAAARGCRGAEDRAEPEIRAAALRGARHRPASRTRTPC